MPPTEVPVSLGRRIVQVGTCDIHCVRRQEGRQPERTQQRRKSDQVDGKFDQAVADLDGEDGALFVPRIKDAPMTVTLTDLAPVTVAYLRHVGPYGAAVARFWQSCFDPWLDAQGLQGVPLYGISHDDPSIADPSTCRFDAGAEVPTGFVAGAGVFKTTLPGGRYAVLPFSGRPDTIGEAWQSLMRDWLPRSGWQLDARPCFERYPPGGGFDAASGTFRCEICMPVTPL